MTTQPGAARVETPEATRSAPAPALRTQLLAGLALIMLVLASSTGIFAHWSARQQLAGSELTHARALATAIASLASAVVRDASGTERARTALRRLLASTTAGAGWGRIEVFSSSLELLAAAGRMACGSYVRDDLRRAMRTGSQLVRPVEADELAGLEVVTPIYRESTLEVDGAIRLCVALADQPKGPLASFWIIIVVDSLALLLFVGLVVKRYVTAPLRRLQLAAAQVARGDLEVRLEESGSAEIASLADSFNRMTRALQEQMTQLQRQQQSLVQSEKLASVGRLAAGVAHEVGNPLQSIIGFTDILLEEPASADREDYLRRIQRESQRIHGILRELLDYSRPGTEAREPVALAEVVEDARSLLGHTQRFRAVQVQTRGVESLPPVSANAARLVQVLVNLLLNAADAMKGEGTVMLDGAVSVERDGAGELVCLRVANTGPAISAQDRALIFDPFFTTKPAGEGTGLGLAVAQSIVESFGGRLVLEPTSEGTCFAVTLPRAGEVQRTDRRDAKNATR